MIAAHHIQDWADLRVSTNPPSLAGHFGVSCTLDMMFSYRQVLPHQV